MAVDSLCWARSKTDRKGLLHKKLKCTNKSHTAISANVLSPESKSSSGAPSKPTKRKTTKPPSSNSRYYMGRAVFIAPASQLLSSQSLSPL